GAGGVRGGIEPDGVLQLRCRTRPLEVELELRLGGCDLPFDLPDVAALPPVGLLDAGRLRGEGRPQIPLAFPVGGRQAAASVRRRAGERRGLRSTEGARSERGRLAGAGFAQAGDQAAGRGRAAVARSPDRGGVGAPIAYTQLQFVERGGDP